MTHPAPNAPPTLRPSGASLKDALAPASLRAIAPADLARWLCSRRWFGAKGRSPTEARIAEVIPLRFGSDQAVVTRVAVPVGDGVEHDYQLALIVCAEEPRDAHAAAAVLARVECGAERGVLLDALEDVHVRAWLGGAFGAGVSFEGEGGRWSIEPVGDGARGLESVPSNVARGEQTNTSVYYGDRAILKVFRRLEHGEHPDVEVCAFLTTHTAFRHVPRLLGVIRYADSAGRTSVAGMMSQLVVGASDGWTIALDTLRRTLASPQDPPPNAFLRDAASIGGVTRDLHAALASRPEMSGFRSDPVTRGDVDRWAADTRTAIDHGLTLLGDRASMLDARLEPMARAIAGRRAAVMDRLDAVAMNVQTELDAQADADAAPRKTRHHGDYHLGQLLRDDAGEWFVVDFEGEPTRPLAERRALRSPLRDVAGMLRSFGYAAATGAGRRGGLGANARTEILAAHWERDVRAAFLGAYGARADDPLIALFEMEKMFYELNYELNNRPEWVWIPLRAVAKLF